MKVALFVKKYLNPHMGFMYFFYFCKKNDKINFQEMKILLFFTVLIFCKNKHSKQKKYKENFKKISYNIIYNSKNMDWEITG